MPPPATVMCASHIHTGPTHEAVLRVLISACMLQAGARSLNLQASGHDRILKDSLEHALRQACALLIRQAAEKGASAMLYAHGAAPEPSLERLIDFTVFAAGSSPANFDPGEYAEDPVEVAAEFTYT